MQKKNRRVGRKLPKSQLSHQHNTAQRYWPIHTRILLLLPSVSLMSAHVLCPVWGPMLLGRHRSAQAPKLAPQEWWQVKKMRLLQYPKNVNLLEVVGTMPRLNLKKIMNNCICLVDTCAHLKPVKVQTGLWGSIDESTFYYTMLSKNPKEFFSSGVKEQFSWPNTGGGDDNIHVTRSASVLNFIWTLLEVYLLNNLELKCWRME